MQVTARTYRGRQWSYGRPGAGKVDIPPPANARLIARTASMVGGTTIWWRVRWHATTGELAHTGLNQQVLAHQNSEAELIQ
ncbi:hypothetical protein B296_00042925 [Ensete ventricosum]|uniref:Uncharacterized protein n=1 Tax=Ensete ventricosum TaxID=4639 RepID=A0A426XW13_ENSVE|nr:hypothetical protein B296_00042925 [Ensete ventricosum]